MRYRLMFGCAVVYAAMAGAAMAKDKNEDAGSAPPPVFQAVLDCKAIADAAERLTCYDSSVAAMETASQSKDLVVADRSTMREAQRGLFGLSLPKIRLFGGDESEEVTEIESTVASYRAARDGFIILELADGARWKQTEGRQQYPKVGDKVRVRKGALSSFFASIDDDPGFKVIRLTN
jgi:hypothetical protein